MARSRFRRSPDALPPLRLTARDDAILADIARIGPCLVDHLRRLHFPSYKTAAERAMKLFHHRFLDRRPLEAATGQPAMAHVLAERGIARLAELGVAARPPLPADAEPAALGQAVARAGVLVDFVVAGRHPGIHLPIVEASPAGREPMPDALVVIDIPSRLFRRVLLLDFDDLGAPAAPAAGAESGRRADGRRARFSRWRSWATRPAATIEADLQALLTTRGVHTTHHRARVSIAYVVGDPASTDDVAQAAVEAGCGPLIYLAEVGELRAAGPLGAVWTQARVRAADGVSARKTSVLA